MPTEPQRAEIRRHIDSLTSSLSQTPESSEEAEEGMMVVVAKLLLVLPGHRASVEAAEAKGEAYLAALDDVPVWAVQAAIRNLHRRGYGESYDYRWAPVPAELRRIALIEAHRLRHRIATLERVLSAQERIDYTTDFERGRKAMGGLRIALSDGDDPKSLTFEEAIKIFEAKGKPRAAGAAP
jgi:hypothetical protein